MSAIKYKKVIINGVSIAYTEQGSGQPILFVHGFASFSYTWMKMIDLLPVKFKFITIDLKGHGYSEKKCDENLALFDHALIVKKFIKQLNLDDFVLVGHSMGGTICLLSLFDEEIRKKTSKLILLNCAGFVKKLHDYFKLAMVSLQKNKFKLGKENLLALSILEHVYYDKTKIQRDTVVEYGKILRQKNSKECLYETARQCVLADIQSFHKNVSNITVPTQIIWGEEDTVLGIECSDLFLNELSNSKIEYIPNCAHFPQEEKPFETAEIVADFLGVYSKTKEINSISTEHVIKKHDSGVDNERRVSAIINQIKQYSGDYVRNIKVRRLVDKWSFGVLFMVTLLKMLQALKKIGVKQSDNGWRRITGVFLRNEQSKFILASFRLNYSGQNRMPNDREAAKKLLIERLMNFLRSKSSSHWALKWGIFRSRRRKTFFTDIVEAHYGKDGMLISIVPHFDNTRTTFTLLKKEVIQEALGQIINVININENRKVEDHKRAWIVYKKLRRWIYNRQGLSFAGKSELCHLVERVLDAAFIQFDILTDDIDMLTQKRFATPNMKKRRHPGFGLLNVICRFTADYSESDLWFQCHHVPVDGMPIQEMLQNLNKEWGKIGPVKYPALSSPAAQPEVSYFGDNLFRARMYVNFDMILSVRKYLNTKYYVEMGGLASVASLIAWGLAQQKYFKERKFLVPLDAELFSDSPQDSELGLIFIRPGKYFDEEDCLKGFFDYQREYNRRLFVTKQGESESYELIELYSMVHPFISRLAKKLIPKAFGEMVGSAGLTVLKDTEMFIGPLTDLQYNGFAAVGNLKMPTEDGKTAGTVSVCSTKVEVQEYIKAIYNLAENYPKCLGINSAMCI